MYNTILVNGKKLSWLVVDKGFKIPSFNYSIESEDIKGRAGAVRKSRELKAYSFDLPLIVLNDYVSENGIKSYEDIANELTKFFDYDEPVKLQFEDKDWYWNAEFAGTIDIHYEAETNVNSFTVKVVLNDPYRYALKGSMNTAISDQVSIVNTGTSDAPIIIEARALKNSTNFMIAKGVNGEATDYFMVGQPEDAYKEIKDTEPYYFSDEFNTLDLRNWNYVPNDTTFGGGRDGGDARGGRFSLYPDKQSIYVTNWGTNTSTNWHGAGLQKSVSKSLQDFRIRFKLVIRHHAGVGTGKSFAYVKDENDRVLFSIGYVNTTMNKNDSEILVYAYNEHGEARKIYSKATPYSLKSAKNIHVFMYLERRGQDIKITTFKYNTDKDKNRKKPLDNDVRVIKDRGNFYQRKARIMNIYSGKSSKSDKFMAINVLGFSVQELLPRQSDVTPIVIRKGDLVYIDTKEHIVTINDDNVLHLKDFGSNYFNVEKGVSELIISPEATFDTTVKWTERYI